MIRCTWSIDSVGFFAYEYTIYINRYFEGRAIKETRGTYEFMNKVFPCSR